MFGRFDLTKNFPNGDKYRGEATGDNVKDGRGTFLWGTTGDTYTGEWRKDAMCGKGELKTAAFQYNGEFAAGKRHGRGRCAFVETADGQACVYDGEWHDGEMCGSGVFEDNQVKYTGTVVDGLFDGRGVSVHANGDRYEGEWKDGRWHGDGCLRKATGDVYSGGFYQHQLTGTGRYQFQNGDVYEGAMNNGQGNGEGKMTYANGDIFVGAVRSWLPHGRGRMARPSGQVYLGEWNDGYEHGQGVATYPAGSDERSMCLHYDGSFADGERNGFGIARREDGSTYTGEFRDGYMVGTGTLEKASEFHHEGHFDESRRSGYGRCEYRQTGDVYDGEWVSDVPEGHGEWEYTRLGRYVGSVLEGKPCGAGEMDLKNGEKYVGEFKDGDYDGCGKLTYPNGDHYDGSWRAGVRHGHGTVYLSQSSNSYTGEWQDDKQHGRGKEVVYGVHHYTGEFEHGKRQGRGVIKYNNGEKYEGEFGGGVYSGKGKLETKEGSLFEGAFLDGKCHGQAKASYVSGSTYDGEFRAGVMHGSGKLTYRNKDTYAGEFAEGLRHGRGLFRYFESKATLECVWQRDVLHGTGTYVDAEGTEKQKVFVAGSQEADEGGRLGSCPPEQPETPSGMEVASGGRLTTSVVGDQVSVSQHNFTARSDKLIEQAKSIQPSVGRPRAGVDLVGVEKLAIVNEHNGVERANKVASTAPTNRGKQQSHSEHIVESQGRGETLRQRRSANVAELEHCDQQQRLRKEELPNSNAQRRPSEPQGQRAAVGDTPGRTTGGTHRADPASPPEIMGRGPPAGEKASGIPGPARRRSRFTEQVMRERLEKRGAADDSSTGGPRVSQGCPFNSSTSSLDGGKDKHQEAMEKLTEIDNEMTAMEANIETTTCPAMQRQMKRQLSMLRARRLRESRAIGST